MIFTVLQIIIIIVICISNGFILITENNSIIWSDSYLHTVRDHIFSLSTSFSVGQKENYSLVQSLLSSLLTFSSVKKRLLIPYNHLLQQKYAPFCYHVTIPSDPARNGTLLLWTALQCPFCHSHRVCKSGPVGGTEADSRDPVKTFWLRFELKQRLKDLQFLFNEVEKLPFPNMPSLHSLGDMGLEMVDCGLRLKGSKAHPRLWLPAEFTPLQGCKMVRWH